MFDRAGFSRWHLSLSLNRLKSMVSRKMGTRLLVFGFMGLSLLGSAHGQRSETTNSSLKQREQALENRLTGATLVGHFTDSSQKQPQVPQEERYFLKRVRKLEKDQWLFEVRIVYGTHDLTLPLTLPIGWADDTPVILVKGLSIPGLGTFHARVIIHDGYYAGYWHAEDHGGHLFGRIVKELDSPKSETKQGQVNSK